MRLPWKRIKIFSLPKRAMTQPATTSRTPKRQARHASTRQRRDMPRFSAVMSLMHGDRWLVGDSSPPAPATVATLIRPRHELAPWALIAGKSMVTDLHRSAAEVPWSDMSGVRQRILPLSPCGLTSGGRNHRWLANGFISVWIRSSFVCFFSFLICFLCCARRSFFPFFCSADQSARFTGHSDLSDWSALPCLQSANISFLA